MNIDLTPELERIVQKCVKSGRYSSTDKVVQEALRLLEQREEVYALRQEEVRRQIEEGWQSARRGELVDGDDFFEKIDAELAATEQSARR